MTHFPSAGGPPVPGRPSRILAAASEERRDRLNLTLLVAAALATAAWLAGWSVWLDARSPDVLHLEVKHEAIHPLR